jgi:multidrug efflux pump subunit AcrB
MYHAHNSRELAGLSSSIQGDIPRLYFDVDRDKARLHGVQMADIFSTLKAFTGSLYVNDFNMYNRVYRVYIQAEAPYRAYRENLNLFSVKGSNGAMIPITALGNSEYTTGLGTIKRFNMFQSATITGEPGAGYSSGEAIQAVREVAAETLPAGYGFEFGGMSREEASSGKSTAIIFVFCIICIYLILCALYESVFIPIVILLSVPFGLAGSFLFARMFGLENNIYLQIGLLMLIGLLAKTAILLTEFASEARRNGMSIMDAAKSAAEARLRPILMTSLTMIFGMLPLMFSTGVGANGNISIGVGTVGGMLVGTLALIFIVPVLFVIFRSIEEKIMPRRTLK